jgi:hypothetical protein
VVPIAGIASLLPPIKENFGHFYLCGRQNKSIWIMQQEFQSCGKDFLPFEI